MCSFSCTNPSDLINHLKNDHWQDVHNYAQKNQQKKPAKRNYIRAKARNQEIQLGAIKKRSIYSNALNEISITYPESQPQCIFSALDLARKRIRSELKEYWTKHASFRWQLSLDITMTKIAQDEESVIEDKGYFTTNIQNFNHPSEFAIQYDNAIEQIWQRQISFQKHGSGWTIKKINFINVFFYKFRPFTGSSYLATPKSLTKSVINVKNKKDKECFKYAVAGIFHDEIRKRKKKLFRPRSYTSYFHHFNWQGLDFSKGVNYISDLDKFEKNNPNISLNVLMTLYDRSKKNIFPLRITKKVERPTTINLLFIYSEKMQHGHWSYITNIDRLCSRSSTHSDTKTCLHCLQNFTGKRYLENYHRHLPDCQQNKPLSIKFPKEDEISFKNFHNSLRLPFVIYADFESILTKEKIVAAAASQTDVSEESDDDEELDLHGLIDKEEEEEEEEEESEGPSSPKKSRFMEDEEEEEEESAPPPPPPPPPAKRSKFMESVTQHHIPCGYSLLCQAPPSVQHHFPQIVYCGENTGEHFIKSLFEIKNKIDELTEEKNAIKDVSNMLPMTEQELELHKRAKHCFICKKEFSYKGTMEEFMAISKEEKSDWNPDDKLGPKVRDHDHWSSKYRGAAHSICNLNYRGSEKIPIIFHNGKRYDNHFLLQFAAKYAKKEFSNTKVLGKTMEQFSSIFLGKNFVVKDSFNFLNKSLESLVSTMNKCENSDKKILFHNLYKFFQTQNVEEEEVFDLLLSKQHYCYEYMDSFEKFSHGLPPKEEFKSSLKETELTDEEYAHVENIFNTFNMKTMKDLHNFYVQTDVALLADVFENFRKMSMDIYDLDPAHYSTTPSLSWDAALKCTEVKLDIIKDIEMVNFLDRGMYGGFSAVLEHFSRANNIEMTKYGLEQDTNQPQKHIFCVDCNNQYGWVCMSTIFFSSNFFL